MASAQLHIWARPIIEIAFFSKYGRPPTIPEAQVVQGVGSLETDYGKGWKLAGKNSKNWGAIQKSKLPCDPRNSFQYTDTTPQPDGTSRAYSICFKKYERDEDGAADLVQQVYVRRPSVLAAAIAGNLYLASANLYSTRYYEGFGPTPESRIRNHHRILADRVMQISRALGESFPAYTIPEPEPWHDDILEDNPTISRGSYGNYVKTWQRILNESGEDLAVDGAFGQMTKIATVLWQNNHGLNGDGIVGPRTWGAAAVQS